MNVSHLKHSKSNESSLVIVVVDNDDDDDDGHLYKTTYVSLL